MRFFIARLLFFFKKRKFKRKYGVDMGEVMMELGRHVVLSSEKEDGES
jgi:peroxiredoxin